MSFIFYPQRDREFSEYFNSLALQLCTTRDKSTLSWKSSNLHGLSISFCHCLSKMSVLLHTFRVNFSPVISIQRESKKRATASKHMQLMNLPLNFLAHILFFAFFRNIYPCPGYVLIICRLKEVFSFHDDWSSRACFSSTAILLGNVHNWVT